MVVVGLFKAFSYVFILDPPTTGALAGGFLIVKNQLFKHPKRRVLGE